MISKELLREKAITFLEYMGVYIDDLEDNEKLEEFADILTDTEGSAKKTNGLVYKYNDEYFLVINFLDGDYLVAPVEYTS
ncbi:MAG: hypothetical protein KZY61_00220 [Clostridiaceae bacterium]|nr:hypothetical protein [Clostridiaceae bacterium]MBW4859995.1 hypothetical protein [Clostridiaceae bacterium]MBW4867085.1 hypothetical protein [Clostridiaceae bacterium]